MASIFRALDQFKKAPVHLAMIIDVSLLPNEDVMFYYFSKMLPVGFERQYAARRRPSSRKASASSPRSTSRKLSRKSSESNFATIAFSALTNALRFDAQYR